MRIEELLDVVELCMDMASFNIHLKQSTSRQSVKMTSQLPPSLNAIFCSLFPTFEAQQPVLSCLPFFVAQKLK